MVKADIANGGGEHIRAEDVNALMEFGQFLYKQLLLPGEVTLHFFIRVEALPGLPGELQSVEIGGNEETRMGRLSTLISNCVLILFLERILHK